MDEEKPYNNPAGFPGQPGDEAVVQDSAAATAADGWGVWEGTQEDAAPMPEEFIAVDQEDGVDWQEGLIDEDATANDEAMAHALYMEELVQFEAGQEELRHFEAPRLTDFFAGADGQARRVHAGQAAHQFGATPHVHANHHGWPTTGGHGEAVTIRLEPRQEALISARQNVLAGASSTPGPAVLVGMEVEDAQDDGWYDSIVEEAQRIEAMDDPELYATPFQQQQQQLPMSTESPSWKKEEDHLNSGRNTAATNTTVAAAGEEEEEEPCREFSLQEFAKRWRIEPSELDPDEPGPSTKRHARVPPLDKKDVPRFYCGICMRNVPVLNLFHGMRCDHRFCVACMAAYINGRVNSGEVPIPCPDPACEDVDGDYAGLHPEECKKSIDFAAFGSWGDRLTERAIPSDRRAYCPNRRCGVMLEATGGDTPVMAPCPECFHPMCATCGMDWSIDESGQHDCTEGPEAALVKKMADERQWKQCPQCRMLVERTAGCRHMTCRCSFHFCYDCGLPVAQGRQQEEGAGEEMCQCHRRTDFQANGFP